ncbi:hypothetical protein [Streptomyces sp. NBC_00207]|uniref:hypothetical protein n=1 Tax=Streptomyces sp. NBC_00207 TaxID=2903635 RepID=UPI003246A88C
MSLVHVHGIGNRHREAFEQRSVVLEALFRRHLLPATGCDAERSTILGPWWGGDIPPLAWNGASLRRAGPEVLGGPGDGDGEDAVRHAVTGLAVVTGAPAAPDRVLITAAATSMAHAIGLLSAAVSAGEDDDVAAVVDFCARATAYCDEVAPDERLLGLSRLSWAKDVEDDEALIDAFADVLAQWTPGPVADGAATAGAWEQFGRVSSTRSALSRPLRRINRAAAAVVAGGMASAARQWVTPTASSLLGDVMAYLACRGTPQQPGAIVTTVTGALDEAAKAASELGEPLVVVAHSMGGNIVHDILSTFRPDLEVDLLVTAGTQVGMFEEQKLFLASDPGLPHADCPKVPALANVRRWINTVDPGDPVGFLAAPVFEGAEDFVFSSGAWWAHSGYLTSPVFHTRLAARVSGSRV